MMQWSSLSQAVALIYLSKADALIFTTEVPLNDWKRFYPPFGAEKNLHLRTRNPPSEDNQGNGNKKECDFVYLLESASTKELIL